MIVPAAKGNGSTVIASVEAEPSPQEFVPFTVMSPEIAVVPKSTSMLLVVLVPVAPLGNVQIYDVALVIAGTV